MSYFMYKNAKHPKTNWALINSKCPLTCHVLLENLILVKTAASDGYETHLCILVPRNFCYKWAGNYTVYLKKITEEKWQWLQGRSYLWWSFYCIFHWCHDAAMTRSIKSLQITAFSLDIMGTFFHLLKYV